MIRHLRSPEHTGRVQDPALLRSEGLKIIQAASGHVSHALIHSSGSAPCTLQSFAQGKVTRYFALPCTNSMFI